MRRSLWILALLAAGCGGGDDDDEQPDTSGTIAVTVECAGPGCGVTGAMKLPVHEDACGGSPLITLSTSAVTLTSSNDFNQTVNGLVTGDPYCVEAWLDLDASGTLNTGDAIDPGGGQNVDAGAAASLTFTLDSLQ